MDISIIRSETWLDDNYENIQQILKDAVSDLDPEYEEIVNIEKKIESNGLSRFWIYVKKSSRISFE